MFIYIPISFLKVKNANNLLYVKDTLTETVKYNYMYKTTYISMQIQNIFNTLLKYIKIMNKLKKVKAILEF